eukprot:2300982-Prymnesium_polylepis.2
MPTYQHPRREHAEREHGAHFLTFARETIVFRREQDGGGDAPGARAHPLHPAIAVSDRLKEGANAAPIRGVVVVLVSVQREARIESIEQHQVKGQTENAALQHAPPERCPALVDGRRRWWWSEHLLVQRPSRWLEDGRCGQRGEQQHLQDLGQHVMHKEEHSRPAVPLVPNELEQQGVERIVSEQLSRPFCCERRANEVEDLLPAWTATGVDIIERDRVLAHRPPFPHQLCVALENVLKHRRLAHLRSKTQRRQLALIASRAVRH